MKAANVQSGKTIYNRNLSIFLLKLCEKRIRINSYIAVRCQTRN